MEDQLLTYAVTNHNTNSNVNTNTSNNTIILNRNGKEIEITANDSEQLEQDNQKLEESLKNNQEKSDAADLENSGFIDSLYDGERYDKYLSSNNGESISIGGKTYNDSFEISNNGFTLFNLDGNYSKVTMDVGRIDDSIVTDAEIKIYLDDKLSGSYKISGEKVLTNIDIDLTDANSMRITLEVDTLLVMDWATFQLKKLIQLIMLLKRECQVYLLC